MTSPIIKRQDTVLVTGAHGFVGKHLIHALLADHFRYIIYPRRSDTDFTDYDQVNELIGNYKPKAIVHLAGTVGGIGANQDSPGKFFYDNTQMGINTIHAGMINGVKRIVMLGTVCAYPKHTPVPFAEEHLWFGYPEETNAPYGIAKRGLIQMCQSYNEQYGMNNISLLPTNMFGPGDNFNEQNSHVIPALIRKFYDAIINQDTKVVLWGSGNVSREFLYVKDCVDGIIKAMQFCHDPGPINLGTGKEITIKKLAHMIAGLMNYEGEIIWDTNQPDGQPRRCLKTDKALDLFNWKARTRLITGLVETILWYEEECSNASINDYL